MNGIFNVATWNTEWATLTTERGRRVATKLAALDADIIVVTEGARELLPADGNAIDAGSDWGYALKPKRRKVILWSRLPISLENIGETGAVLGRLAVATVETPAGLVRVVGVCIPWRDAHVNTGRSDATPWSEHLQYLEQLQELIGDFDAAVPTVIAGDFNQRIPRVRQPIRVADRLARTFSGWPIHTTGNLDHGPHIDHIASSEDLVCQSTSDWPGTDSVGRLSDHSGVICRFLSRSAS